MRWFFLLLGFGSCGISPWLCAQQNLFPQLVAEGTPLPRFLTVEEQALLAKGRIIARGATEVPVGPVHCPAEYEPMDGILIAYEGPSGWLAILDQMATQITTLGNADIYVMADSAGEANTIFNNMNAAGANMTRVNIEVVTTDSIWMRDYGPRYIYEGNCRAIVDHTYNRPRPNDNLLPTFFGNLKNHRRYPLPLVHGGGNYHLHATGLSHATRLINNENPGLSEQEIYDLWATYQNLDTQFYQPFPLQIDATQHIDMWMEAIADREVIISDWPFDSGSIQDQICDAVALDLLDQGFTVHRVPARSVGGTHYTYTNVVMCNDIVLLPSYTQSQVVQHNSEALTVWQNALPGKTIIPINCQDIVTAAGVMHCIVMHLPAAPGGANPTVFLRNELGNRTYLGGQAVSLDFLVDDNEEVIEVDILYSEDDGQSFAPLQTQLSPLSPLQVNLPTTTSFSGKLRILARDADNNTGFDGHELSFVINGQRMCPEDCYPDLGNGNFGDGVVNSNDLFAIVENWGAGFGPYDVAPAHGNHIFGDESVNIRDAIAVVNAQGPCP